jgi:hypothetical protein
MDAARASARSHGQSPNPRGPAIPRRLPGPLGRSRRSASEAQSTCKNDLSARAPRGKKKHKKKKKNDNNNKNQNKNTVKMGARMAKKGQWNGHGWHKKKGGTKAR